ncbi:ABC transporter permease [Pseudomonas sp. S31]|uniref:ABC transporter permease n=1 Tax=Pseudomonas sp. S31 TaxID=1564473 RepID=UPI0019117189|nr:ABC transporter permease [Pseudomonas sp. S31]MBK5002602.1 ABC transporter permease [Pseudomonas sp. S31]
MNDATSLQRDTTLAKPAAPNGNLWYRLGTALAKGPAPLYLPAALFLLAFFIVPLGYVLVMSVTEPKAGLGNFTYLLSSRHFFGVLLETFKTAAIVTLCSVLLGYPLAYLAAGPARRLGGVLLAIIALSFWTSFLVRTYAWMVIFGRQGPLSQLLATIGWTPPPKMLFTSFSATVAMTHAMVPFMVMAMYAVMKRIDARYVRAAQSLGAHPLRAFTTVYLPLSLPGVVNGCTLVFITCLGFYVMPVLLGSPNQQMISGVIGDQIEQVLDFGAASAMSVILLVITVALFWLYHRFIGLDRLWRK